MHLHSRLTHPPSDTTPTSRAGDPPSLLRSDPSTMLMAAIYLVGALIKLWRGSTTTTAATTTTTAAAAAAAAAAVVVGTSQREEPAAPVPENHTCVVCLGLMRRTLFPPQPLTPDCAHPHSCCLVCVKSLLDAAFATKEWVFPTCPDCGSEFRSSDVQLLGSQAQAQLRRRRPHCHLRAVRREAVLHALAVLARGRHLHPVRRPAPPAPARRPGLRCPGQRHRQALSRLHRRCLQG
jgi:hypothetical protein